MEKVDSDVIKIPKSQEFILEGPREGETSLEKERRLLMNSFKSGKNVETLRRMEEEETKRLAEKKALEEKEILESQSRERYFGTKQVTPEDLRPSPFVGTTEDNVANVDSLAKGERFEKRTDYDLNKEKGSEDS